MSAAPVAPPAKEQAQFFPISELSAYTTKWTIKAKVTSKSQLRTFNKGGSEGKVFSVELLDTAGGDIRASFFGDAAAKYFDILQSGKVYTFSRGSLKVADRRYNTCNSRYDLTFDRDAQVEEFTGAVEKFEIQFNFVDVLAAHGKQPPCRVDLLGVVTRWSPVATVNAKDGRELVKRDITIADDTARSMDITLWGDLAKKPDAEFDGKPVVALKGFLLKEWNGEKSASSVESSMFVLKPEVPEAARVAQWWAQGGATKCFANITDLKTVESKPAPSRFDLCGIITQAKPTMSVTTKDGRELLKRDITIADDSGVSMDVTLWGDHGKRPDADFEGQPTVMLKAILVKEWNGGRNGSTISSSVVELRPDTPEAKRIERWWTEGGSAQSLVSLRGASGEGSAAAKGAEHCSGGIEEMRRRAEVVGDQVQHFKVAARLALVQTRKQGEQQPLHYLACAEPRDGNFGKLPCNKRVDSSSFCASCNRTVKTATRLAIRCRFSDCGDSAWLTTFHEAAEQVLGMSADKVATVDIGDSGREDLEGKLRRQYFGQPMELLVRAKLDMYNGEPRANVTCVGSAPINRREHGRKLLSEINDWMTKLPAGGA